MCGAHFSKTFANTHICGFKCEAELNLCHTDGSCRYMIDLLPYRWGLCPFPSHASAGFVNYIIKTTPYIQTQWQ